MTLETFLKGKRYRVKIGTTKGKGFVYCGVSDTCDKKIIPLLKREVAESYMGAYGDLIIIVEGGEQGTLWTNPDDNNHKIKSEKGCEELVNAVYKMAAADLAAGLIDLDHEKRLNEQIRMRFGKELGEFAQTTDLVLARVLLQKLGEDKELCVRSDSKIINIRYGIMVNESFLEKGEYGISPDLGASIIDKTRKEVRLAIDFVDRFIDSDQVELDIDTKFYTMNFVRMAAKKREKISIITKKSTVGTRTIIVKE